MIEWVVWPGRMGLHMVAPAAASKRAYDSHDPEGSARDLSLGGVHGALAVEVALPSRARRGSMLGVQVVPLRCSRDVSNRNHLQRDRTSKIVMSHHARVHAALAEGCPISERKRRRE